MRSFVLPLAFLGWSLACLATSAFAQPAPVAVGGMAETASQRSFKPRDEPAAVDVLLGIGIFRPRSTATYASPQPSFALGAGFTWNRTAARGLTFELTSHVRDTTLAALGPRRSVRIGRDRLFGEALVGVALNSTEGHGTVARIGGGLLGEIPCPRRPASYQTCLRTISVSYQVVSGPTDLSGLRFFFGVGWGFGIR